MKAYFYIVVLFLVSFLLGMWSDTMVLQPILGTGAVMMVAALQLASTFAAFMAGIVAYNAYSKGEI